MKSAFGIIHKGLPRYLADLSEKAGKSTSRSLSRASNTARARRVVGDKMLWKRIEANRIGQGKSLGEGRRYPITSTNGKHYWTRSRLGGTQKKQYKRMLADRLEGTNNG